LSGRQRKRFHTSEIMSAPAQLCKRPPPGRIVVVGLASPNFVRPVTSSGAPKDRTRKGRPLAFGSGRAYNIGVKLRHAATLVLGISGCGSRIPPGWKFVDWLGPCLIFLVTVPWFRTGRLISSSETIRAAGRHHPTDSHADCLENRSPGSAITLAGAERPKPAHLPRLQGMTNCGLFKPAPARTDQSLRDIRGRAGLVGSG
jgi:hypothetical protein